MTLPARKEGIIPGAANLRLPRFVGDRIARQAILAERRIDCASPEGRLICDDIVAPDTMDSAIERLVERLTSSGVVSAAGNRRALRIAQEPLDAFRRYMSVYAREQAHCHFSPALIANLSWIGSSEIEASEPARPPDITPARRVSLARSAFSACLRWVMSIRASTTPAVSPAS